MWKMKHLTTVWRQHSYTILLLLILLQLLLQPVCDPLMAPELCLGLPGWASTRKLKPGRQKRIWIYWSKIVNGSDIIWTICKSAPCPRHITMPASHHSAFYSPDVLPATQPIASKHWRVKTQLYNNEQETDLSNHQGKITQWILRPTKPYNVVIHHSSALTVSTANDRIGLGWGA